jgi:hypothetical protein
MSTEIWVSIGIGIMTILLAVFGYTKLKKFDFIFKVVGTLMPTLRAAAKKSGTKWDDKALDVLEGLLTKYDDAELKKTKAKIEKMDWSDLKKGSPEDESEDDD